MIPGQIYKHVKSGRLYEFITLARSVVSPSREIVVYKALYSSELSGENPENDKVILPFG